MGGQRLTMEGRYDAIVVLSHHLEKDGSLDFITRRRTDAAIDMHKEGLSELLIVSGGIVRNDDRHTHGYAMSRYAIEKGVSETNIIIEYLSHDTAGQIPIIEHGILKPKGIERIIMVSGKMHISRVERICKFVNPDREIEYIGVEDGYKGSEAEEKERNSLGVFEHTFRDIEPGDADAIIERLFAAHPLYIEKAEDIRQQLEHMKSCYKKRETRQTFLPLKR